MSGFKGRLLNRAGVIRVDRSLADLNAVKDCAAVLKEGHLLGMFPSGGIGKDSPHGGVMLIAAMARVPVVPAFIIKRKHFWQRHKVVFGKPILVSDYTERALPGRKELELLLRVYSERLKEGAEYGYRS